MSGSGMWILFSNLLLMAGSSSHGVLVAPKTRIPLLLLPTPCIWTRNSVLILLEVSFSPSFLDPQRESISSMKIIAWSCSLAIVNNYFTSFSDSPSHLETKSEDEIEKKVASASVAQALARNDLPVPGGPYRRIPVQGVRSSVKSCGNLIGKITASCRLALAVSNPQTSLHLTFGFSVTIAEASAPWSLSSSSFFSSPPPFPSSGFFLLSYWAHLLLGASTSSVDGIRVAFANLLFNVLCSLHVVSHLLFEDVNKSRVFFIYSFCQQVDLHLIM